MAGGGLSPLTGWDRTQGRLCLQDDKLVQASVLQVWDTVSELPTLSTDHGPPTA